MRATRAEAASWYLGDGACALFRAAVLGWNSGLEPPPHLVGERARALDVLAAGGLVCARAAARGAAAAAPARPERLDLAVGDEPGIDALAEHLALAGYERVERVEERGQFAVRGGIVDVFPTTGREPLRIELFGDEIEAIRAFSPFTQRALRPVEARDVYPAPSAAGSRRADAPRRGRAPPIPTTWCPLRPRPRPRLRAGGGRAVWEEEARPVICRGGAARPFPRGRPRVRGAAAAVARARLAEASRSSPPSSAPASASSSLSRTAASPPHGEPAAARGRVARAGGELPD
jgi:hypothetical protein